MLKKMYFGVYLAWGMTFVKVIECETNRILSPHLVLFTNSLFRQASSLS